MPDGITVSNRVDTTTERKLYAKVVDNILNSRTYASRLLSMGKPFFGKTQDFTVKVVNAGLGEWFVGLETLSTTTSDTTVTLSYSHTAFDYPVVIPMLEAFANQGPEGTINLERFKYEEAVGEAIQQIGTDIYADGSSNRPDGLAMIVDDGTSYDNIGGQSRATYTSLKATSTSSSGVLSLTKLGTLHDAVRAAGIESEEPTIHVTTKTVWSLYEHLLQPTVRASYEAVGYDMLPVKGEGIMKRVDLKGAAGFTALSYRGVPVIADDGCTSGVWFMLNERYLNWYGRTMVPEGFKSMIEKVNLGSTQTTEGVMNAKDYLKPSEAHGFFYQKLQVLPNQAGAVGRLYLIGQLMSSQPRRNGKLTAITTS